MRGRWHNDGPLLSVAFARESGAKAGQRKDKITLVTCDDTPHVRTLWTLLDVPDLSTARQRLAKREGISKRWESDIGLWNCGNTGDGREAATMAAWAGVQGLEAVVWTNLPCPFDRKDRSTAPGRNCPVAAYRYQCCAFE